MLADFQFHHIGIAVKDIKATSAIYEGGGYKPSTIIYDPIQNVDICWLTKDDSPTLELLAPVNENSPVNNILEKNGVSPYHTCYVVKDIQEAISELRKQKYVMISKPAEAVAFKSSKVAFLFNKNVGLIELVETPAEIID